MEPAVGVPISTLKTIGWGTTVSSPPIITKTRALTNISVKATNFNGEMWRKQEEEWTFGENQATCRSTVIPFLKIGIGTSKMHAHHCGCKMIIYECCLKCKPKNLMVYHGKSWFLPCFSIGIHVPWTWNVTWWHSFASFSSIIFPSKLHSCGNFPALLDCQGLNPGNSPTNNICLWMILPTKMRIFRFSPGISWITSGYIYPPRLRPGREESHPPSQGSRS